MPSPKRASMREGPLSALFRRTDEPGEPGEEPSAARRREPEPPAPRRAEPMPAPATPAAQERRPSPPHPRETGYPHPSLGTRSERAPAPEPDVPTPQERLRHAFSADLPDDVLQRVPEPRPPHPIATPARPTSRCRGRPRSPPDSRCCASSASAVPASTPSTG